MKKICFIAPKAYPVFHSEIKSKFGGAEIQLYLLAKELAKDSNYEVSLLVGDYRQKQIEYYNKIKVIKAVYFRESFLSKIYLFYKSFKKVNADIYVQTSLMPFSGIIALYCKLRGKKMVYRVSHDAETDGGRYKNDGFLKYFLSPLVFRFADSIVVQNSYQKQNLENKHVNSTIIRSANHSSALPIFSKEQDIVLWVGRYKDWKKPDLFIKLVQEFPNYKFIMICQKPEKNSKVFKNAKEEAGKIKNLEFIPFVPFDVIDRYFARAKLLVNTSEQEGFPNTFIQACASGVPILSFKVNPDNIINKYELGIFADGDWQGFINGFKQLLDNSHAKDYSSKMNKYIIEQHDIKSIVEEYKKIFS